MSRSSHSEHISTVLVADDEHLVAAGIASSLRALGYEVMGPFSDGNGALAAVSSGKLPDLAMLDIRMPGADGLEIAQKLWTEFEVPSIIISAFSDQAYVDRARQPGVFGYLLKPVTTENLRTTIGVAWSHVGVEREQLRRVAQLELTIAQRRTIEQAKWALVKQRGLSETDAHNHLQRTARNERRRLIDVAEDILRDAEGKP